MKTTEKLSASNILFLEATLRLVAVLNLPFFMKVAIKKTYKSVANEKALIEDLLRDAQPDELKKLNEPSAERLTQAKEKEKAEKITKLSAEFEQSAAFKEVSENYYEVELYKIPLSDVPKSFRIQDCGIATLLKPREEIKDEKQKQEWIQLLTSEIETALELIIE